MYQAYYGLKDAPFSITPDPYFVYLSECHRDALAHLLYGIQQGGSGGFVQLTGEVGTGKTTLSRLLLNQLPENTHAALVLNPRLEPVELLETICEELRIPTDGSNKAGHDDASKRKPKTTSPTSRPSGKQLFDALSAYLLDAYAKGDRVVLIIDEAQNLSSEALEQVRLLTNLETETQKLLQIILIGQPELRDTLARPELRQLAQRITARYHLRALDQAETEAYLRHRIATAGGERFPFSPEAVRRLFRHSGGVPRLINVIAERSLLGGYSQDQLTLDAKLVDRAALETLAPSVAGDSRPRRRMAWAAAALLLASMTILGLSWTSRQSRTVDAATATRTSTKTPLVGATKPATAKDISASLDATSAATLVTTASYSDNAWRTLLARWDAPVALSTSTPYVCPAMAISGWRCLRARASIDQLLQLDRPVLLRLQQDTRVAWAMLQGADAGSVMLLLGDRSIRLDRIALAGLWNGDYLAIWPAPDGIEQGFAAGEAGAIDWVRQHLQASKTPISAEDAMLTIALRRFQSDHGLRSDGILGPETLFVLSARDAGSPLQSLQE